MKTVTVEPLVFTFGDFLQMHSWGLLAAVIVAVGMAWVFAERGA